MEDSNEKKGKIEKVQDSLYSKNTDSIFVKRRHGLNEKEEEIDVSSSWKEEKQEVESEFKLPYTKILLGALIFFVLTMVFAFSRFFMGSNTVSGNNIDILVSGPVSIAGGEELPLEIEVKNNNNIDLKVVDLRMEFPAGTKSISDQSIEMKRLSEVLGDINVGQSEKRVIKSILYGEENTQKTIKIKVEYRIAGSNAIFSKEKDFIVLISSSPVNIIVNNPSEINSNQLTTFNVDVTSNSSSIIKNLILKVDYPFGFDLVSSDPRSASYDNSIFVIGDLAPGAKRTIRISGIVSGQDGEERSFKFTLGNPDKDNDRIVSTVLATYMSTLSLRRSAVGVEIGINDETGKDVAINVGSRNRVHLFWKNNLSERIYNMSVRVKFSGQALNRESFNVENGYYNSSDNSVIFDKSDISLLSTVNPLDTGDMSFDFSTLLPASSPSVSFGDSSVKLDITVLGNRTDSDSAQEILFSETRNLKISSQLRLLSRGFRTVGPFENSGPFPPKADNETTYTITWTSTNSFNNVTGVRASAFLPPNVKWTGYTSPETENITYNQNTGEVVWDIGDLRSETGTSYRPRDVSFQVAITPSVTQIGYELNLLNEATISGIDAYSGARIGEVRAPVTTNIVSDPAYINDIGRVVR
jgi:hypothetical protein